jgi:4-aminobutyrate aminotransferase/(S)-3-amino-2-methylpropionate transaminase
MSELSNQQWQGRKEAAVARGQGNLAPVYVERAEGSEIWDVEGKRYIDFGTGIAVCNTGHMNSNVKAAVLAQLERFSHTCFLVTPYDSGVELAEKLNELAPGNTLKKTVFSTTGAEAIENCIKIARAHTGRRGVIAFNGGFHGRTLMTMGLTGKIAAVKNLFGPFPAEIYHAPFPIPYHGVTEEESFKALDNLFHCDIAPSDVAAIVIEPVQGEGGFYPAPSEFLRKLRELCDEHGILLVADEIQSGFGRTGKLFACEHAGIEPDLMAVAKGMSGGFPLAAVVGKADIMDAPHPGGLGGTFAGSPIGCAAALAVIETIKSEDLVGAANRIAGVFNNRLTKLQSSYPDLIGEIRSQRGAMIAIEIVKDGNADLPNPELVKAVVTEAYKRGLVILSCGIRANVFRFLPALTISDELINEGMNIFEECLEFVLKK